MKRVIALSLAWLLPLAALAQAVPGAPLPIDPGLRNKQVTLRLRDARVYQGKLLDIQPDSLVLQVKNLDPKTRKKVTRTEIISRADVVWMDRNRRSYSRAWGWAFGVGVIITPIAIAFAVTDKNRT
ncbi:MAG TPA: hypothetical protein VNN18_06700 [Candidatus Xenobia bacterium]|nr:hypothetical protein [Candidatus Xenobia bacterium]